MCTKLLLLHNYNSNKFREMYIRRLYSYAALKKMPTTNVLASWDILQDILLGEKNQVQGNVYTFLAFDTYIYISLSGCV